MGTRIEPLHGRKFIWDKSGNNTLYNVIMNACQKISGEKKMQEIKVNSSVLRCDDNDIKDMSELNIGSPVVVFAKGYSDWSICPRYGYRLC